MKEADLRGKGRGEACEASVEASEGIGGAGDRGGETTAASEPVRPTMGR